MAHLYPWRASHLGPGAAEEGRRERNEGRDPGGGGGDSGCTHRNTLGSLGHNEKVI